MRATTIDVVVCVCVCVSVLVTTVYPAKTDEPIEMPYRRYTHGARKKTVYVSDGGSDILMAKGHYGDMCHTPSGQFGYFSF